MLLMMAMIMNPRLVDGFAFTSLIHKNNIVDNNSFRDRWMDNTRQMMPFQCNIPSARLYVLQSSSSSSQSRISVVDRLNLSENFNRWRFLQNLLDEDVDALDVNEILFVLLDNYRKNNHKNADPMDSSAPERTPELLESINQVLERSIRINDGDESDNDTTTISSCCILPVLVDPNCTPANHDDDSTPPLLTLMEQLLPDPKENEEAHKGAWDTVLELHGRTAVAMNEKEARPAWKAVFMIARVMIYFEFLSGEGLVSPTACSPTASSSSSSSSQ
ncbi:hypothetical protein MHU86_22734 [Fragilaria crotonensis]|nr:hypothetical protein MHU86_22734 [Fragilaria crotonensis]